MSIRSLFAEILYSSEQASRAAVFIFVMPKKPHSQRRKKTRKEIKFMLKSPEGTSQWLYLRLQCRVEPCRVCTPGLCVPFCHLEAKFSEKRCGVFFTMTQICSENSIEITYAPARSFYKVVDISFGSCLQQACTFIFKLC